MIKKIYMLDHINILCFLYYIIFGSVSRIISFFNTSNLIYLIPINLRPFKFRTFIYISPLIFVHPYNNCKFAFFHSFMAFFLLPLFSALK